MHYRYGLLREFFAQMPPVQYRTAKKNGRSAICVWWDILFHRFWYGASPDDYEQYALYRLDSKAKQEFIMHSQRDKVRDLFNDPSCRAVFVHKEQFNSFFMEFVGREWLYAPAVGADEIMDFLDRHRKIIVKPSDGLKGQGVSKLSREEIREPGAFCEAMRKGSMLLEEVIEQHAVLAAVNPNSVNTLRIHTVLDRQGKVHIINAVLRCASGESVVDNRSAGGIACGVDLHTGKLNTDGINAECDMILRHPVSGVTFSELQMPMWPETLAFVERAALAAPCQARLIGWDVAVASSGPLMVEGNIWPHFRTIQFGGNGVRRLLERYV